MHPSPLGGSICNALSNSGLANVEHGKECFVLLLVSCSRFQSLSLIMMLNLIWCFCFVYHMFPLKLSLLSELKEYAYCGVSRPSTVFKIFKSYLCSPCWFLSGKKGNRTCVKLCCTCATSTKQAKRSQKHLEVEFIWNNKLPSNFCGFWREQISAGHPLFIISSETIAVRWVFTQLIFPRKSFCRFLQSLTNGNKRIQEIIILIYCNPL